MKYRIRTFIQELAMVFCIFAITVTALFLGA